MAEILEGERDGRELRLAWVVSRYNEAVTERLLAGAERCVERHGAAAADRLVVRVPGAWELPLAARKLAGAGGHDAIIALGALIRGETPHFDVLVAEVARGLGETAHVSGVPVIFGVLTCDTLEQALARSGAGPDNKGWEATLTGIEMARLYGRLAAR